MSTKLELFEKARESQKRKKLAEGYSDRAAESSTKLAKQYCDMVSVKAAEGSMSYFFDMSDQNVATINLVSMMMKEELGDVLILVSPRGIEANWKMSE